MTQPDLARLEGLLANAAEDGFTPEIEQQFMDELPALLARVRELREALEPFARQQSSCALGILASDISQSPCDHCDEPRMHCFQVRRARAALALNKETPDADR